MQVSLNVREKKVIKRIAKIQLESLNKILEKDCQQDILLWCLEGDIDPKALDLSVRRDISIYQHLFENPETFLNLGDEDMSICKHILHKFILKKNLQTAKTSVWRKMVFFDSFHFNLN